MALMLVGDVLLVHPDVTMHTVWFVGFLSWSLTSRIHASRSLPVCPLPLFEIRTSARCFHRDRTQRTHQGSEAPLPLAYKNSATSTTTVPPHSPFQSSITRMDNEPQVPPLDQTRFTGSFEHFCKVKQLELDRRSLRVGGKVVDLHTLHEAVMNGQGYAVDKVFRRSLLTPKCDAECEMFRKGQISGWRLERNSASSNRNT